MLTEDEMKIYRLKKAEQIMSEQKLKSDKDVTDEKVKIQTSCKNKKEIDNGKKGRK